MDVFCKIIAGEIPSIEVYSDELVVSIMDANPSSPGHLLIIPKKHYTTILDMDDEINNKIQETARMLIKKIKHYHMHLLPVYEKEKKPELSQADFAELLKK